MATFKPEVNYKNMERYGANCRACEVKLTSENFGEKINDEFQEDCNLIQSN